MIRFEQTGEGVPKDIHVVTDDGDAELAAMTEAFEECAWTDSQAYANLAAVNVTGTGDAHFIIPGNEAGEVAEVFEGVVPLMAYLDDLNQSLIDEAERKGV